ncbi:MAG: adenosylcobinamide-GDP ribazoletransferase [Chloroflexota bacterium]|nr:adenosylcobinamide-GDP ribazoletransferase [Chloroflexota bacterium]
MVGVEPVGQIPPSAIASAPWWAPFALAGSFLTSVPVPQVEPTPQVLGRAIGLFPAIGGLLGALLGAVGLVLDWVLPGGPVAALLLAVGAVLTGGLHLDGLMDTADGVLGGRTVERRLEIMRDSRVGAFGATAGGLALVGQYACLAEFTGFERLAALVLAYGLSRWTMVVALGLFPPARPTGLGAAFHEGGGQRSLVVATLLAAVIALACGPLGFVGFAFAAVTAPLGGRFLARRLGGLTGDTYGALAVVTETLVLYVAVAFRPA